MVVASKHSRFGEIMPELDCKELYHPWTQSCLALVWDISQRSLKGSAQLFTPLYMLQLILSRHIISREYLKHHAKNYIRSIVFGNLISTTTAASCCVSRRLLGKFYYYTFLFLPAILGGFAILVERRSKQVFYTCGAISLTMEYVIRQLVRADKLQLTKLKMCTSFMILNAAAMYLMRIDKNQRISSEVNFWFFTPPRVEQRDSLKRDGNDGITRQISVCYHSGSCWSHAFKEATLYLGFGVAGQMLRILLPQIRKLFLCPAKVLRSLFLPKNLSFGMFFAAYVGTYHAVSCFLARLCGRDSEAHAVPAGFLAGAAFLFDPKLSTLLAVFTTIIQQLTKSVVAVRAIPCPRLLTSTLFAVFYGVLFHGRIVDKDLCHSLFLSWINMHSGDRCEEIRATYMKFQDRC